MFPFTSSTPKATVVQLVPIAAIQVPEGHREYDEETVKSLARSIDVQGLLQPIAVRRHPRLKNNRYYLVYGFQRLAAVLALKRTHIEARILDVDDDGARMAKHAENLFRLPLEEQRAESNRFEWNDLEMERIHRLKLAEESALDWSRGH